MADKPNTKVEVLTRTNRRRHEESYIPATHMKIDDLKEKIPGRRYLSKGVSGKGGCSKYTVPNYPQPVEFRTSTIAHETNEAGTRGILDSSGFKAFDRDLLWWVLKFNSDADDTSVDDKIDEKDEISEEMDEDEKVEKDEMDEEDEDEDDEDEKVKKPKIPKEIAEAEQRYLEKEFPGRTEEEKRRQEPFLHKLATSPVFKDESRYGHFRFSFPLEEVLQEYSRQFCGGKDPVFRVFETVMYSQEIMYVVLVHSPDVHDYDKDYPEKLGDNKEGVCAYRDGEIIWHAQAISATHTMELCIDRNQKHIQTTEIGDFEWYVWDIVTLALHLPNKTFEFPKERLVAALSACDQGYPALNEEKSMSLSEAEGRVQKIKATGEKDHVSSDTADGVKSEGCLMETDESLEK